MKTTKIILTVLTVFLFFWGMSEKPANVTFTPEPVDILGDGSFYESEFQDSVDVTLTCATPSAEIYYFLNDGDTVEHDGNAIRLYGTTNIKAFAVLLSDTSDIMSVDYIRTDVVGTPQFLPLSPQPSGVPPQRDRRFIGQINVTIIAEEGAEIRYTTDNSSVTETSPLFNAPILLTATTTIKAKAFKTGDAPSAEVSGIYTLANPTPVNVPYSSADAFVQFNKSSVTEANGYVHNGLGSDNVLLADDSTLLKLDTKEDELILAYSNIADKFEFKIGVSAVNGTIGIYSSKNGYEWDKIDSIVRDAAEMAYNNFNMPTEARYVRLKVDKLISGSFALGNISLTEKTNVNNEITEIVNSGIKVYPNPANGRFNIKVAIPSVVTIFNAVGVNLRTLNVGESAVINSLGSGLYIIRAIDANGSTFTERIIIN